MSLRGSLVQSALVRPTCHSTGCVFVPNILRGILSDPSLRSDQVHPNDAGYRIIAERVGEAVAPHLKR